MTQLDLLSYEPSRVKPVKFDGETFSPEHDSKRLGKQYIRVWDLMKDGKWRTQEEIEAGAKANWASCSARLRDFRKSWAGGHIVERKRVGDPSAGIFAYRLLVRSPADYIFAG